MERARKKRGLSDVVAEKQTQFDELVKNYQKLRKEDPENVEVKLKMLETSMIKLVRKSALFDFSEENPDTFDKLTKRSNTIFLLIPKNVDGDADPDLELKAFKKFIFELEQKRSFSTIVRKRQEDFNAMVEKHRRLIQLTPADDTEILAYLELLELEAWKKELLDQEEQGLPGDHNTSIASIDEGIKDIKEGALKEVLADQKKWGDLMRHVKTHKAISDLENALKTHAAIRKTNPPPMAMNLDSFSRENVNINANAWRSGKVDTIIKYNRYMSRLPSEESYTEQKARIFLWTEY